MSISLVLKLKKVTSEKYSPISTTSALRKAKGLTWGSFLVKTPMFIECLLLHHFFSWSSMIHTSMKLLSLSMQVMASFPLYLVSLISLLSLPSEADRGYGNKQWLSLFTSNVKTLLFQVRYSYIHLSCDEGILLTTTSFHQIASIPKLLIQTTRL